MNLKEFWGLYRLKFTDIKLTVASFTRNALFKKHHRYRSGVSPVIHSTFNSLVKECNPPKLTQNAENLCQNGD